MKLSEGSPSSQDPGDSSWNKGDVIPLAPTTAQSQPNHYIRAAFAEREFGKTNEVSVALKKSGDTFFARLEWDTTPLKNSEFPDSAAIFFPSSGDQSLPSQMGSRDNPVRMWQWKDRLGVQEKLPPVRDLISSGPGVFHPTKRVKGEASTSNLSGSAQLENDRWSLVIGGDLKIASGAKKMGVAIWNGSNQERAGIGAVSTQWIEFEVQEISSF